MDDISLESLLRQYISNSINGMFTAIPGRIERVVSLSEQRVDVRPIVNRITPDEGELEHPVVLSVPLVFPGSNTSQFSFPVSVGDIVLLVFSQRSIQRFKLGANNKHRPLDFSKYSRNDAIAIPGLFSFPSAVNNPNKRSLSHSTSDTVITHNIGSSAECEVRLKASGDVIINAPGNNVSVNCSTAVVNADSSTTVNSPTSTVNGDVQVNGDVDVSGDVTASGVSLVNHTHTGDSGGTTSPPN